MKKLFLLFLPVFFSLLPLFALSNSPVALDTLIAEVGQVTGASCFGGSDGAISLTVQGTPPLSFQWNNGDTTQDLSNIPAGIYDVIVTDSAGTQLSLNGIEVGQPDELQLSLAASTLPGCNGQLGALIAAANGGTPGYTFDWSNAQTGDFIENLPAGDYEVTVTDANGCTAVLAISLQPQFPAVELTGNGNLTCVQSSVELDGSASASGTNFTFQWTADNGGQFASPTDTLAVTVDAAGIYTLEITDTLNGCAASVSVEVLADTLSPQADAGQDTIVACTNSEIVLNGNAVNGTVFSYLWAATDGGNIASGETTATPTVDHAGTFILTVTNVENGCEATDTVSVSGTNEPPVADLTGGDLTCLITQVSLSAMADTVGKIFTWEGPDGFTSNELNPVVDHAGDYIFTLTDTLTTCTGQFSVTVEDNAVNPLLVVLGGTITCTAPAVMLTAMTSSADAVFEWTGPGVFSSNEQNPAVSEAGSYTLLLTDTLTGCTATETAEVLENTTAPLADAGTGAELNCFNPTLQLDGSASSQGDHFTYEWTTGDGNITAGATSLNPDVDAAGVYTLTVTDTLNGCSASAGVAVSANFTAPVADAIGGTFTCFDGSFQVLGVFDSLNVTFGWEGPNGFVSSEQNPVVSQAGDYILTVTDTLNGCSATATATVEKIGTDPELTTAGGTITCSEPTVQLTVEAQIGDIIWSWASEDGFTSTEQNPTVTEPGIYTVLAIDTVFGCVALDTAFVEIDTLSPLAGAGQGLNFNCHISSATLNGTASQGADFTYLWTTPDGNIAEGETTLNPLVDASGTYTLTVTYAGNGCTASSNVVISQTPPVTADIVFENATCNGTATGSASVTAGGGTGDFTFAWSSGSTSETATGLVAGEYFVTVTDGDGCSATNSVSIAQPDVLTANATGAGQSLAGIDDGTAAANPSGGTQPFTYEWSNGETTQSLSGLAPGAYTVTVTDANGCTAVEVANVNEFPCVLYSVIVGENASCFGLADGSAVVTPENAIGPISFEWSNGDTLNVAGGLAAGQYFVTVTDSTNCKNILAVTIQQPAEITVAELYHVDVVCPGETSGFVIVGANGGVQPYQFSWSNGSFGPIANGLGAGDFTLTLTDATGCEQTFSTTISVTDSEAPALVLQNVSVVLDENGEANVTAAQFDAGSSDNCGITDFSINTETFDCTHLGDQTVTVTATDLNGNQSSGMATVTITDDQAPVLTCPADLAVSACNTAVEFDLPVVLDNCSVDFSQLQQTAGLPSGSVFPLGVSVQTFVYTDPAGNTGECTFEIVLVEQLEVASAFTPASCAGACDGTIDLAISNGLPPYSVTWSNGSTGTSLSGLCAGNYSATISDAGGCESVVTIEITEPAQLELAVLNLVNPICANDLTGEITTEVAGGTAPINLTWSNGTLGDMITGISAGTYELTATDANGCSQALAIEVNATDSEAPVLTLQNATVSLGTNGTVTLDPASFDAGSTDNCGIAGWTVSPSSFDCNLLGNQQVTLTASDANGNSASATASVTVVDNIAPILTCPANITAGFCNPTVAFVVPQVQDNCVVNTANLQQTAGQPSGSLFPAGVTTQTFSYTDASGNTGTCSFTVTVNAAAMVDAATVNASCAGVCDGSVTLNIGGGAAPFGIAWSNGQTGLTASGLCAGSYSASITDAAGCLQTFTTTLSQPMALALTIDQVTNDVGAAGLGSISISVTGGTSPYSFAWTRNGQPFASTEDLANLQAGQYTVAVTDANGCEIASQTIVVENVTGTTEPAWGGSLTLWPNPASDWVRLELENELPAAMEIRFINATGLLAGLFNLEMGETAKVLNLENLAPGMYIVQLRSADEVAVRRIVIGR